VANDSKLVATGFTAANLAKFKLISNIPQLLKILPCNKNKTYFLCEISR
jgi:hypothetical protein